MSVLGSSSSNNKMGSFFEFRKQASFYLKEKIKTARLALTDVTPTQLLTEEATNANPWAPDTRTLGLISKSAFEVDDYWRIVEILHNRLSKFDRKNWRASYNALIVLEHLLTHGPESVADEFQTEKPTIKIMENFQHIDERGFNWGLAVRKKSERVLKLLEKGIVLKEERENARKLTREIQGFGSFSSHGRPSSTPLKESSAAFGRSHSQFNEHGNVLEESGTFDQPEKAEIIKGMSKENVKPRNEMIRENVYTWDDNEDEDDGLGEANSLLSGGNLKKINGGLMVEEDEHHPFNHSEKYCRVSLLDAEDDD